MLGSGIVTFERLELASRDWHRFDAFDDRVIFQTREWVEFVAETQAAEPVAARLVDSGETVGCFTGLIVRRFGVRILGSPFPGWTTASMGFNLGSGLSRRDAAALLPRFAFGTLNCLHLELKDRWLAAAELHGLGFESTPTTTFEVDLAATEDEIFGRMTSSCRRAIRKSAKEGVIVEEVPEDEGESFAADYYSQLEEVFARQGLRPTYGVERVRALVRHLHPTGRLLLLRALSPDGAPIATALFPAMNGTAYFWGGASRQSGQILRPNEAVFWYAMRYWKARGIHTLDLGGGGEYKRKYGPRELVIPFFRKSRLPGLGLLREGARRVLART